MLKYILLIVAIAFIVDAQDICNPEPDCSNFNCAVDCRGIYRAVYVGCNCCEYCVQTLGVGYGCNYNIEPKPGGQTGPSGNPRVPTYYPICAKGLHCDETTMRCVRD